MSNYVWKVKLSKTGRKKIFKELVFIAENFFELAHIVGSEVYESDMFDFDVEVKSLERVEGLGRVVNFMGDDDSGNREWTGEEPLKMAENMPDERVMNFKCVCHEELRIADFNWPFVKCHNCGLLIHRREIKNIGGLLVYSRIEELHKDDKND